MYVRAGLADTALENPKFTGKTRIYKTWMFISLSKTEYCWFFFWCICLLCRALL